MLVVTRRPGEAIVCLFASKTDPAFAPKIDPPG
jgi:hypothetical protein